MDNALTLYEHIRNRLPTGYGLGDDESVLDESNNYNHSVWEQTIREDHEGDVGIFEIYTAEQPKFSGYTCYVSEIQIAVVTKQGDIDSAKKYLKEALENIKRDDMSEHFYIKLCKLINIKPIGKNSNGLQMVVLNIKISYLYSEK